MVQLNPSNFNEVVESGKVLAVKFGAPWCGTCKSLEAQLDQIIESDKYQVAEVNVEESADIAAQYGIMSIPALLFFKDGQKVDEASFVGFRPAEYIQETLDSLSK
ncbi:thioredoxin [Bacillus phage SP-15]|uniref:Thioredoxin n=1 Tax=Bacillus phage SP-15 TaxID=1792032 RepID=A0A127AXJ3_9CAUD|nr:thioredoxin domain [Bacillus phage SP-15]AMM44954.1 thioredoxin [Bacillus phage SP-15]